MPCASTPWSWSVPLGMVVTNGLLLAGVMNHCDISLLRPKDIRDQNLIQLKQVQLNPLDVTRPRASYGKATLPMVYL